MKFFKYFLFLVLIACIALAIYIAVQPNSYEVKRELTIEAPVSVAYENVVDLKNWEAWSPWVEKDPNTDITLGENTLGVGGSYSWTDSHGKGSMKTKEVEDNTSIDQELRFDNYEPSNIHWKFEALEPNKTKVTWTMSADKLPFMYKAYALANGGFDNMVGPDFERGLVKLDSVLQESMKIYNIKVNGVTQHSGGFYLYNTTSCKISEVKAKMQEMLPKVIQYASANNISIAGAPYINYIKWDEANNATIFSCCVPTTAQVITADGSDILTGYMDAFRAVETTLTGNYDNLKEAWDIALKYVPEHGYEFQENGPMLETYLTDPIQTPNPAEWVTKIYIAIKNDSSNTTPETNSL
ncbi:GyrI-like domain-containing protein [Mangrovimonas sp. DI 80]|uniref:SRPBCC family protein n=1 Tax=Mangrovimonas sp. DI 80 TaxID=1779330 RepID=UPI0009754EB3|nr:GyrI-like domain-containing protein [Mangrovimonas sp. DI 80]OMP30365.1 transcription activator effector-binding protein [Mangrovimonas sp. DI 80]